MSSTMPRWSDCIIVSLGIIVSWVILLHKFLVVSMTSMSLWPRLYVAVFFWCGAISIMKSISSKSLMNWLIWLLCTWGSELESIPIMKWTSSFWSWFTKAVKSDQHCELSWDGREIFLIGWSFWYTKMDTLLSMKWLKQWTWIWVKWPKHFVWEYNS